MINIFGGFLGQIIGAAVIWAFKGFKGSFNDEMAGPDSRAWKSYRNIIVSIIIVLIVVLLFDI